jgi:hypothetical protein
VRAAQMAAYSDPMSDRDATPISYMALEKGTPVLSGNGDEIARVEKVLDDPSLDLFDGIVVETQHGTRFVDADAVVEITDKYVRTSAKSADELPESSSSAVLKPNEDALTEKDSFFERALDVTTGDDKPGWERQKDPD